MKAIEAVKQIQAAVADAKASGAQQILIANLEAYLDTVVGMVQAEESSAGPQQVAEAEHRLEVWKAQLSANTNHSIEMFKAVIEAGQTALKSAIVINGGAAAALLAFAGNAITKGPSLAGDPLLSKVGIGLAWFVAGLGCAGWASGLRYLGQFAYAGFQQDRTKVHLRKTGNAINSLTIALGIASFLCFVFGGHSTYSAIAKPSGAPVATVAPQKVR